MKKFICVLVLLLALACSPRVISNYTYFYQDTVQPQMVVDSLLGKKTSNYKEWFDYKVVGIHHDSTYIDTYITWVPINDTTAVDISVIEYGNSDTSTVKSKIVNPLLITKTIE